MDFLAVRAVLGEVRVVAVQAVHALVTKLAGLAKSAVNGSGEGPAVFAIISVTGKAGIEAHVTVLGKRSDIPVIAVLAGSGPRSALGRFEVKFTEVFDEVFGFDWHSSSNTIEQKALIDKLEDTVRMIYLNNTVISNPN